MFSQLVTSKRELWVVETDGGLFHSLAFAVSVETLLGNKGPAVTLLGKKGPTGVYHDCLDYLLLLTIAYCCSYCSAFHHFPKNLSSSSNH